MIKQKLECPHCGSASVVIEANARWDMEAQDYVLDSTTDDAFCGNCESEFHANLEDVD